MIGPGMIGLFTSPYVAIALLCIGGFAHQALSGALITLSSDVFGRNDRYRQRSDRDGRLAGEHHVRPGCRRAGGYHRL